MADQRGPPHPQVIGQPSSGKGESSHSQIKGREEQSDLSPGEVKLLLVEWGESVDSVLSGCPDDMGTTDEGKDNPVSILALYEVIPLS